MVNREELIAIVGGALAGLVVLMVVIAICVYCCCGRKRDSKKNIRRFQPLPTGNDSSKPSTLNGIDPRMDPRSPENRLPKVGSSGLWMGGTPSMYASPPPQTNYHYADKDRHGKRSSSLQRASSEERLHQSRGHNVYGGGNIHLYHSNPYFYDQFHGLPRSNSYLNMYGGYPPYPSGSNRDSRAMLMDYPDGHDHYYDPYRDVEDRRHGKKVKRTHSDLTGTKRKKREKRRESPSFESRKNKSTEMLDKGSDRQRTTAEVHRSKSKSKAPPAPSVVQTREQRPPREIVEQTATIEIHDNDLSECATDSAKIRAMQGKTYEPEPISMKWEGKEDLRLNIPSDINDDVTDDLNVKRYQYDGHYKPSNKSRDEPGHYKPSKTSHEDPAKTGYTNEAYVKHEEKSHKRLDKRESNTDGKQVSAAFDFLNNYMSDDEETVFTDSRRQSPLPFDK